MLSIIVATFTEHSARRRALGFFSAVGASGSAAGLLFGGVLTDALSWRWIFFVNVPVGLLAGALALRYVPDSRVEHIASRRMDVPARPR